MESVIENLKDEINKYKTQKLPFPEELKDSILDLLKDQISGRQLAKSLGLHHTTIVKWNKNTDITDDQQVSPFDKMVTLESNDQVKNDAEVVENTLSPVVITPSPPKFFIFPLVTMLITSEYYLLNQSYFFHKFTLHETESALIKALLGEAVPIFLTIILYASKINWLEKIFIHFCLIISFLFSAYTSGGYTLNIQSDTIYQESLLREEIRQIEKELEQKTGAIEFYKKIPQKNGTIGWPLKVAELEKEYNQLSSKVQEFRTKLNSLGDVSIKNLNKWFDLILKILIQITCLYIVSIIAKNFLR